MLSSAQIVLNFWKSVAMRTFMRVAADRFSVFSIRDTLWGSSASYFFFVENPQLALQYHSRREGLWLVGLSLFVYVGEWH